jgi:hypothetical protein
MGRSTSGTQPKSQKIEANNQERVQKTPRTRPVPTQIKKHLSKQAIQMEFHPFIKATYGWKSFGKKPPQGHMLNSLNHSSTATTFPSKIQAFRAFEIAQTTACQIMINPFLRFLPTIEGKPKESKEEHKSDGCATCNPNHL